MGIYWINTDLSTKDQQKTPRISRKSRQAGSTRGKLYSISKQFGFEIEADSTRARQAATAARRPAAAKTRPGVNVCSDRPWITLLSNPKNNKAYWGRYGKTTREHDAS